MVTSESQLIHILILAVEIYLGSCGCDRGWFGLNCNYKCQCLNSLCFSNGECQQRICSPGYFGPSCQYGELVYRFDNIQQAWLTDGNPATCSPKIWDYRIHIFLSERFHITWIKMDLTRKLNIDDLQLTFNFKKINCTDQKHYFASDKTVYITCKLSVMVEHIEIEQEWVPHMCNLQISAGRSLGMKHPSNMSSTTYNSTLALDGIIHKGSNTKGFCAQTTISNATATFSMFFKQPPLLHYALLYNQYDTMGKMKSFVVKTYSSNGRLLETYTQPATGVPLYVITFSQVTEKTSWLTITSATDQLAICELETFGEIPCPPGKYGLECTKSCNCKNNQRCFDILGVCPYGCAGKYYGQHCELACSKTCGTLGCSNITGDCFECLNGYYGKRCSAPCSKYCLNETCYFTSGKCVSCSNSFYGKDCSSSCSKHCLNTICDRTTGYCPSCQDGYYGNKCMLPCPMRCQYQKCNLSNGSCFACNAGVYGIFCDSYCPIGCLNETCDMKNGSCTIASYSEEESDKKPVRLLLGLFICVVTVIAIIYKIRKAQRPISQENNVMLEQQIQSSLSHHHMEQL